MTCCGQKRALERRPLEAQAASARGFAKGTPVEFEYVGLSTLRVVGPSTGAHYWFARPGARLLVDARDAASFAGVPNLRRVA
ncbi:MAG TPA: hypothetical protein VMG12_27015 [Polyangiaceae bacterium]|nr:hypothetical protein [Polyangiaceae bacterium]